MLSNPHHYTPLPFRTREKSHTLHASVQGMLSYEIQVVPFAASQLITLNRRRAATAEQPWLKARLKPKWCFAARLADPQLQHDSGRRIQGERRSFACCQTSAAADIDDRKQSRPS